MDRPNVLVIMSDQMKATAGLLRGESIVLRGGLDGLPPEAEAARRAYEAAGGHPVAPGNRWRRWLRLPTKKKGYCCPEG